MAQMPAGILQVAGMHGVGREIREDQGKIDRVEPFVRVPRAPRQLAGPLDVAGDELQLREVQQSARMRVASGSLQADDLRETTARELDVASLQIRHGPD